MGANAPKGKNLEAHQISAKQRVLLLDKDIKGYTIPHTDSQGCNKNTENSDHDLADTIDVGSYKGPVDSYADGTWQIVKSKKSHH